LLLELNRESKIAVVMVTHSLALARRMGSILEITSGVLATVA
jgi:predicted ABC-type transport system involved in lysophospholipase L1 biosynthesis ATPase subunit